MSGIDFHISVWFRFGFLKKLGIQFGCPSCRNPAYFRTREEAQNMPAIISDAELYLRQTKRKSFQAVQDNILGLCIKQIFSSFVVTIVTAPFTKSSSSCVGSANTTCLQHAQIARYLLIQFSGCQDQTGGSASAGIADR